ADERQHHQHAPRVGDRRGRDVAQRAQRAKRGEQAERERLALLLVVEQAERFQEEHRTDAVVLGAELQRGRRTEIAGDEQLVLQRAAYVEEQRLRRRLDAEQVIEDALVGDEAGAQEEQGLLGSPLLAHLCAHLRAHAVVREGALDEVAKEQRLLLLLLDQLVSEVHAAVHGGSRRRQRLAPVALGRRLQVAEES